MRGNAQNVQAAIAADPAQWITLLLGYIAAMVACAVRVRREVQRTVTAVPTNPPSANNQDYTGAASGDNTRNLFYTHLCVALLSRATCIPLQALIKPSFWKLIAETLPYLTFASAWTLLVSFLAHLTGTASGTGMNTQPSKILLLGTFALYCFLICSMAWYDEATVLLYAMLSCIYACLCVTLLYFGVRLMLLLQPSLARRSGLALRLISCCVILGFTLSARTVGLVRQVPGKLAQLHVHWWWSYGALELLPSAVLLLIMKESQSRTSKPPTQNGLPATATENAPLNNPKLQSYNTSAATINKV